MATDSSILAWKIPWTEEPGGGPWGPKESDVTVQSQLQKWMGSGQDIYIFTHSQIIYMEKKGYEVNQNFSISW